MCCRYYYDQLKVNRILEELRIWPRFGGSIPFGTINPGDSSLIITGEDRKLKTGVAAWGFPGKDGQLVINARCETAPTKPMFRSSFESRRCLLPAECFYEWDISRNMVTFSRPDSAFLYLAGLWTMYDEELRFVVLTTAANKSMLPVHDRMPLMVGTADISSWLFDTAFALAYINAEMPVLSVLRENEQMSFL